MGEDGAVEIEHRRRRETFATAAFEWPTDDDVLDVRTNRSEDLDLLSGEVRDLHVVAVKGEEGGAVESRPDELGRQGRTAPSQQAPARQSPPGRLSSQKRGSRDLLGDQVVAGKSAHLAVVFVAQFERSVEWNRTPQRHRRGPFERRRDDAAGVAAVAARGRSVETRGDGHGRHGRRS